MFNHFGYVNDSPVMFNDPYSEFAFTTAAIYEAKVAGQTAVNTAIDRDMHEAFAEEDEEFNYLSSGGTNAAFNMLFIIASMHTAGKIGKLIARIAKNPKNIRRFAKFIAKHKLGDDILKAIAKYSDEGAQIVNKIKSYLDDVAETITKKSNPKRVKKVNPSLDATGPYTGFKTDSTIGKVTGYTEFDAAGNPTKRFRGSGKPHGGVEPPFILEPKAGKGPRATPKVPRTPENWELPLGY